VGRFPGKADKMDTSEETYYPAWYPGLPSELRAKSDSSTPDEYVWTSKSDGKWDIPVPPKVTPYKESRMK